MNSKAKHKKISTELSELLTAKELEELIKIDHKTIYRYVSCGLIPYVRIQSNIRFIKWQIVKWIEEQTFLPASLDKSLDKEGPIDLYCLNCPYQSQGQRNSL